MPRFEKLYNDFVALLANSDFKQKHQSDYEALANHKVTQFSKIVALINTLNANPQQYGISPESLKNIKDDSDALLRVVCNAPAPLKSLIEFVADDSDMSKLVSHSGEKSDFVPTLNFMLPVDKQKVIANGTVPAKDSALIVDAVKWTHPSQYIRKGQLMVLDMLAQNNWERPVYFAITVGSEAYQNLDGYFRLDGFTYRLVPVKVDPSQNADKGSINTDILYNALMEKFQWGGINDPRVYLDENNLRMLMNVKSTFSRLIDKLLLEEKKDKAREVLNRCYEVMPFNCVPPSFYDIFLTDSYYKVGDIETARNNMVVLVKQTEQEITFFQSLDDEQASTVAEDRYRSCAYAHESVRVMLDNHDSEAGKIAERFQKLLSTMPEVQKFETMDMNSQAFSQWYQSLSTTSQQIIAIYLYLCDPQRM